MGGVLFEQSGGDISLLVAADEDRLVVAGGLVLGVELVDNLFCFGEDFGAFDGRLVDGDLVVGAAGVEGEVDFVGSIVPVERVFHFVAVEVGLAISNCRTNCRRSIRARSRLAETFCY